MTSFYRCFACAAVRRPLGAAVVTFFHHDSRDAPGRPFLPVSCFSAPTSFLLISRLGVCVHTPTPAGWACAPLTLKPVSRTAPGGQGPRGPRALPRAGAGRVLHEIDAASHITPVASVAHCFSSLFFSFSTEWTGAVRRGACSLYRPQNPRPLALPLAAGGRSPRPSSHVGRAAKGRGHACMWWGLCPLHVRFLHNVNRCRRHLIFLFFQLLLKPQYAVLLWVQYVCQFCTRGPKGLL